MKLLAQNRAVGPQVSLSPEGRRAVDVVRGGDGDGLRGRGAGRGVAAADGLADRVGAGSRAWGLGGTAIARGCGLLGVLPDLIGPMDPKWDQFGFNRPGATVTPGQPENLQLSKITGQAAVLAQCDAVPLATYYRWFFKLIGVDSEFRYAGRTNDPMKELTDQPAAGTLEVKCEAANEAGPGVESATASIDLAA